MLQLDPLFTVNKVTVFGDHADKNRIYYLPEQVQISTDREGKPAFTLMKYMRDITDNPAFTEGQSLGGGFCIFTVDLALDDDTRRLIERQARRHGISNPSLAIAPFHEGTVRLIGADANVNPADGQVRFVEDVQGTTTPSLFGDLRATFSVRLSQEAVELFEKTLQGGGQPFAVVYELKFLGLRPAFDVTVKADYQRIYNEFNAKVGAQYMLLRAEIEAGFQKLEEEHAIEIIVNTFSDDAETRRAKDEALKYFKEDLLKDFFRPSLPLPQQNSGDILSGLANMLQLPQSAGRSMSTANSGGGLIPSAPIHFGQAARTPAVAPPPTAGGPTADTTPAAQRAAHAGSPADAPDAPRSNPPPAATANPGNSTTGGNSSGGGGLLENLAIGFKLRFIHQEELKKFEARWKEASAVERIHAPNGSFGLLTADLDLKQHFFQVDLDSTFFQRLKVDVESPIPFDTLGLKEIKAHLEYGDRGDGQPRHLDDLELKPDANGQVAPQTFMCSLDEKKDLHYQYRLDFFFDPASPIRGQKTHYTTEMIPTFDRTLTIDPSHYIGFLNVAGTIGELDFGQISRVQVKIGYDDDPNQFHVQDTFILAQDKPTFEWKVRLSDPDQKTYWYEVTYFLKEGDQRIAPPRQTSSSATLVVNEPWNDRIELQLDAILNSNLSRLVVEVKYEDTGSGYHYSEIKRFSSQDDTFQMLPIPILNPAQRSYNYRVTAVRTDGSVKRGDFITNSEEYLPVTAPA